MIKFDPQAAVEDAMDDLGRAHYRLRFGDSEAVCRGCRYSGDGVHQRLPGGI